MTEQFQKYSTAYKQKLTVFKLNPPILNKLKGQHRVWSFNFFKYNFFIFIFMTYITNTK